MKITVLGSGTCVPSLKRSNCSILIEFDTYKVLLDCGSGTIRRILEAGINIRDITHIFFSHLHPDHTGGLASFLFSSKYPKEREKPLVIFGGRGFGDFYRELNRIYRDWIRFDKLKIDELDTEGAAHIDYKEFSVDSLPMNHTPESIGIKVTSRGGKSIVYSGDTDYTENLIELSRGVDILFCESALPDALKVSGHLTPSLAGEIAKRAGVKKLVLTHFYPECEDVDIIAECRKTYDGELIIAEDLMVFDLYN
ncbi:MAG: MBL fold metallo-hydrolase [Nitrospirae bacterium]|nr:MAG: MBL fold metallo-hydrolase [Nitrospirota bacterium]